MELLPQNGNYKGVKKEGGLKHEYLGMSLDFSVKNKCHITQTKFITDLVNDWNIKKDEILQPDQTCSNWMRKASY